MQEFATRLRSNRGVAKRVASATASSRKSKAILSCDQLPSGIFLGEASLAQKPRSSLPPMVIPSVENVENRTGPNHVQSSFCGRPAGVFVQLPVNSELFLHQGAAAFSGCVLRETGICWDRDLTMRNIMHEGKRLLVNRATDGNSPAGAEIGENAGSWQAGCLHRIPIVCQLIIGLAAVYASMLMLSDGVGVVRMDSGWTTRSPDLRAKQHRSTDIYGSPMVGGGLVAALLTQSLEPP